MRRTSFATAASALVLSAGLAQAATFDVESTFLAGVTGNTETFDTDLFSTRPSAVRADFTVSETGTDPGITTLFQPVANPNGTASLQFFLQPNATLLFDAFTAPSVTAFGLSFLSGVMGDVDVTVNGTDTFSFDLDASGSTFFGITQVSGISTISFGGSAIESTFAGVDDVFTGTIAPAIIPLPASGLLLIAGLGMLAAGRRRLG